MNTITTLLWILAITVPTAIIFAVLYFGENGKYKGPVKETLRLMGEVEENRSNLFKAAQDRLEYTETIIDLSSKLRSALEMMDKQGQAMDELMKLVDDED